MTDKHPLFDEINKLIKDGEVPQQVSNRLLFAALMQSSTEAKQDREAIKDQLNKVRADVNSNPLGWVPVKWRSRVAGIFGFWIAWVSVNTAGYSITIPAIIEEIQKYLP